MRTMSSAPKESAWLRRGRMASASPRRSTRVRVLRGGAVPPGEGRSGGGPQVLGSPRVVAGELFAVARGAWCAEGHIMALSVLSGVGWWSGCCRAGPQGSQRRHPRPRGLSWSDKESVLAIECVSSRAVECRTRSRQRGPDCMAETSRGTWGPLASQGLSPTARPWRRRGKGNHNQ